MGYEVKNHCCLYTISTCHAAGYTKMAMIATYVCRCSGVGSKLKVGGGARLILSKLDKQKRKNVVPKIVKILFPGRGEGIPIVKKSYLPKSPPQS